MNQKYNYGHIEMIRNDKENKQDCAASVSVFACLSISIEKSLYVCTLFIVYIKSVGIIF